MVIACSTAVTLLSCGGDNNPSSPKEVLEGTWSGTLALVETTPSTCNAEASLLQTHAVTVNENRTVRVQITNGAQLNGTLINDTEFDVRFLAVSGAADSIADINYRHVVNSQATVTLTTINRLLSSSCTRKWAGSMKRQ